MFASRSKNIGLCVCAAALSLTAVACGSSSSPAAPTVSADVVITMVGDRAAQSFSDRKSTRLNSSHTEIYTLSLHDALPIFIDSRRVRQQLEPRGADGVR